MDQSNLEILFETVVQGGYCIGCGNCAALVDSPICIDFDQFGRYQPVIRCEADDHTKDLPYLEVCPFSDRSINEDDIAKDRFGEHAAYSSGIGYFVGTFAGYVKEHEFRARGSSGGLGTWILHELYQQGLIDGVLHVRPFVSPGTHNRLFEFQISTTLEEIIAGAKSRYYPIEMSQVLSALRGRSGRYAVVGLPCFIKAVRLMCRNDRILSQRVAFTISLFCGHLKSTAWAEMLSWQCNVEPGHIDEIDFRKKLPERPASDYGIEVAGEGLQKQSIRRTARCSELFGTDWGLGFFKYKACDFCDDITGETADLCVGDAWIPRFVEDSQGTNVVVVRNPELLRLMTRAQHEGRLELTTIDPDEVIQSQSSNFRHRREGLAVRLYNAERLGKWHPPKRIKPNSLWKRPLFRRRIILRQMLAELSHEQFQRAKAIGKFAIFEGSMRPLIKSYRRTYMPKWLRRIASILRRKFLFRHVGSIGDKL